MKKYKIDVDNDQYKSSLGSITSHSRIAEFYKYRPPYMESFFQIAANKLNLSNDSVLLDLLCGRGELASRFSNFSNEIFAVDGSHEMMNHKIEKDNVTYFQRDVNQQALGLPQSVDHVLIGSAIHWIKQNALQKIINNSIKPNGRFLVSHTLFRSDEGDYGLSLKELNRKFGRSLDQENGVDLWGKDKMYACGYQQVDNIRLVQTVTFQIDYLFYNQLSYAYGDFYDNVMSNINQYKKEFLSVVSPFIKNGKLSSKLVNWGVIYAPCKSL